MHSCLLKILPTKYIFKRNWILYILDSIYIQYKLSTRTICPWTNLKRHVRHLLDTVFLVEKKLVTFWWFRINVWCLINPVWRKSILFLNLFDLFYFIFWLFTCLVRAHSYNNYTFWTIHEQSWFIVKTRILTRTQIQTRTPNQARTQMPVLAFLIQKRRVLNP